MRSSPKATAQQKRTCDRRKRVVTEARKEQNRVAQRAYRRRQKEERLKTAPPPRAPRYPTLRPQPTPETPPSHEPIPLAPTNLGDDPISVLPSEVDWNNIADQLGRHDDGTWLVSAMANTPDRDEVSDDLFNVGTDSFSTLELVPGAGCAPKDGANSVYHRQDLPSGVALLMEGRSESQGEWNSTAQDVAWVEAAQSALADLYLNRLEFSQMSFFQACCFNARCLGIGAEDFASYSCLSFCSPFYRPVTMTNDPRTLLAAVSRPSTPPHLQPTLPQVLFPHHPILDLLPLPELRARAIMLAATAPFLLDAFDLKKDVVQGGLICWAGARGRNSQPWDKRSWEAAPWFLQKWRLLVDGPHSDLWQQSAWWQGMRGEPAAY